MFRALVQDMSEQVRLAVAPVLAEGRGTLEAEERALAAFLVSDAARRITGTVVPVDAGQHLFA